LDMRAAARILTHSGPALPRVDSVTPSFGVSTDGPV
jgi:hypothetical protein